MAVFTPTITGLTSLTTENINIDNNSITALNSSIEQVSYTSVTTNLFNYSEQFDNSYWTKYQASITANAGVAPDGTTTADKFIPDTTASSVHVIDTIGFGVVPAGTYALSVYVKADGYNFFHLRVDGVNNFFNLTTGVVVSTGTGVTTTIEDSGNGWYRCSATRTFGGAARASFGITETGTSRNFTGDGTKGGLLWGAQIEATALTGYLPTTSASLSGITGVTRGVSGTTAATASSGGVVTLGSASTTLTTTITTTQIGIPLASLTGISSSGTASIGTSNMDLNLSASGTGSVTINQIKTNSITGEVIPGKIGGTNFTESLLIGSSLTGTLTSNSVYNIGIGSNALEDISGGDGNIGIGVNALKDITSQSNNTAVGYSAGSFGEPTAGTYIGVNAGRSGGGTGNIGIGYDGARAVSGDYNIVIGYQPANNLTTGDGNVFIGKGDVTAVDSNRTLTINGYDGTTTTTWLSGDSAGLVTMSGGISTPTITGLTSLTTENVNIDNNSITALNSSIEQISYTHITENLTRNSNVNSTYVVNGTATVNNIVAPDGTTTGNKFTAASTVSGINGYGSQLTGPLPESGVEYTYSVHVKQGSVNEVGHSLTLQGAGSYSFIFNFTTKAITDVSGQVNFTNKGYEELSNGWFRIYGTLTPSGVGNSSNIHKFGTTTSNYSENDYYYVWGGQLERASAPTQYYINTSTSGIQHVLTGITRGTNGTTAATASAGATITLGSVSTTINSNITAIQNFIRLNSSTGVAASGTASIGTSNMDLNLSASGTGSVTINEIKTNSVTGEVIPGKIGGTNFSNSLLIGHSTTGTLNSAGQNIGVGIQALDAITSGDANTAIGFGAGTNISSGTSNTAIGYKALLQNQVGSSNTALGHQAGQLVTGDWNVCIGKQSGDTITSGDGNVCIGPEVTVDNAAGDTQLKIGSMATGGGAEGTDVMWLSGDSSGNLVIPSDLTLANNKKVIFGDAGENIVGDGTDLTVSTSNDIIVDATRDIILDGGQSTKFKDDGSIFLSISNSSGIRLTSQISDNDILFRGNDGGSFITALTLDMSDAGRAIFNSSIAMGTSTISNHSTGDITGVGKIVFGSNNSNTNTRIFKNNNKLNIQEGSSGFTILDPSSNTTLDIDADQNISIPNGTLTVGDTVTAPNSNIIQWQSTIITASATVVANKGYFVNTTSNVVTITLPASAIVGDQIILNDYAGTWDNNVVTINRNGLKIQGGTDNLEYSTEFQSVHLVYSGATKGWIPLLNSDHLFNATGGTESAYSSGGNNYKVHTFTSSGTFTAEASGSVDYLVAAGGASGGAGGGGGAGGYLVASGFSVNKGNHTVVVGAGGTGSGSGNGSNGSNSSFSSITSTGGGGGGGDGQGGFSGGSGGGGGTTGGGSSSGGAGTAGQGNAGGNQTHASSGGGGGGSGSIGSNSSGGTAGQGGTALSSSINGTSTARAGGGGGGNRSGTGVPASGGGGGAGNGTNVSGGTGGHATVNTGSGGGGGPGYSGYGTFGSGGSGIVIIRYQV